MSVFVLCLTESNMERFHLVGRGHLMLRWPFETLRPPWTSGLLGDSLGDLLEGLCSMAVWGKCPSILVIRRKGQRRGTGLQGTGDMLFRAGVWAGGPCQPEMPKLLPVDSEAVSLSLSSKTRALSRSFYYGLFVCLFI